MKKFWLIFGIIILLSLSLVVSANYKIRDTGDIAVNGSKAIHGQNLSQYGWQVYDCSGSYDCDTQYDNTANRFGALGFNLTWESNKGTKVNYTNNTMDISNGITRVFYMKASKATSETRDLNGVTGLEGDIMKMGVGGTTYCPTANKFVLYTQDGGNNCLSLINLDTNWHKFLVYINSTGSTVSAFVYEDDFDNHLGNLTDYAGSDNELRTLSLNTFGHSGNLAPTNLNVDELYLCEGKNDCSNPYSESLNVSSPLPPNGTGWNTQSLDFNVSIDSSLIFNTTLFINGIANRSVNNTAGGTNVNINFTLNFGASANHTINYFFSVINANATENTSNTTIFIDNNDPSITWNYPNTNNITFLTGNLTANITVADNNLYSYYYNITYPNGTVLFNYSNTTLTGLTSALINDTSNMENVSGLMKAVVRICDGHTAQDIGFSSISTKSSELNFEGVKVYLQSKTDTNNLNYDYKGDRYSFDFNTKTKSTTKTFIVSSPDYIDILDGKTGYDGHLITGNKWIDFEGDNIKSVTVSRISGEVVLVTVTSFISTTVWNFNSIGELNCLTESKDFFVYNTIESYTQNVLPTQENTFYLNITYNESFMKSISATFNYNGTSYTPVSTYSNGVQQFSRLVNAPTTVNDLNVSFNWTYSINGTTFFTKTKNQSVFSPKVDNCTLYSTKFVNYSIRNELNNTLLNGTIDYVFNYKSGDFIGTYNGTESNQNFFDFCMQPNDFNFTSDITIQYSVSGYDDRTYYADDYIVDNVSEHITLYSLFSGLSTAITIHVIDNGDNDLANVLVEAYRYDLSSNSDLLVETGSTDSSGNVIMNLKTNSELYSFKFYQDGVNVLSTTRFQLYATSYEYVINQVGASRLSEWIQLDTDITRTLTYSNETKLVTFSYTYLGTLASQFCLVINDMNNTNYVNTCSTNTTGTLTYTITELNKSYIAYGRVQSTTGNWFTLITKFIDERIGWRTFGSIGLVVSILIFLVIGLIGTVNKDAAIISGTLGLTAIILFNLVPLSTAWLIPLWIMSIILLVIMNRRST